MSICNTNGDPRRRVRISRLAGLLLLGASVAAVPLAYDGFSARPALADTHGAEIVTMPSLAPIVERVSPAVVTVKTKATAPEVSAEKMRPFPVPRAMPGSPFDEFFRRFFEDQMPGQRPMPRQGLGSGFIIDKSGIVVTNNHVIADAGEIIVVLHDGTELSAELLGHDEKTDIAVLRIDAGEELPTVEWGDSDRAEVGDWVVAVGNPFGLGGTVTAGIVSARGRDLRSGPFDDFLQIDAPINRGNSGGPAFDLTGKVIGINTAIYSPSGGSVGIGFAIPSNLARGIVDELVRDGSIERGWIGVSIQTVTPAIAEAIGLDEAQGALVAEVLPGGPAEDSGLRQGDVILSFDGKPVDDRNTLPRIVADTDPGKEVTLQVLRDGETMSLTLDVGKMPTDDRQASAEPAASGGAGAALGLALAPLTPDLRDRFGIDGDEPGLVVVDVYPDGPAAEAGITPGDVVVQMAGKPLSSVDDAELLIKAARKEDRSAILMLVRSRGQEIFVAVPLRDA